MSTSSCLHQPPAHRHRPHYMKVAMRSEFVDTLINERRRHVPLCVCLPSANCPTSCPPSRPRVHAAQRVLGKVGCRLDSVCGKGRMAVGMECRCR